MQEKNLSDSFTFFMMFGICFSYMLTNTYRYRCARIPMEWKTAAEASLWLELLHVPTSICTSNVISDVTPCPKALALERLPSPCFIGSSSGAPGSFKGLMVPKGALLALRGPASSSYWWNILVPLNLQMHDTSGCPEKKVFDFFKVLGAFPMAFGVNNNVVTLFFLSCVIT